MPVWPMYWNPALKNSSIYIRNNEIWSAWTEVVHLPAHTQPQFMGNPLSWPHGWIDIFGAYVFVQGNAVEHWGVVVALLGAYATSCLSECSPWTFLSILCSLFFYHRIPGHDSLLRCLLRQNSHLRNPFLEPFPVRFWVHRCFIVYEGVTSSSIYSKMILQKVDTHW